MLATSQPAAGCQLKVSKSSRLDQLKKSWSSTPASSTDNPTQIVRPFQEKERIVQKSTQRQNVKRSKSAAKPPVVRAMEIRNGIGATKANSLPGHTRSKQSRLSPPKEISKEAASQQQTVNKQMKVSVPGKTLKTRDLKSQTYSTTKTTSNENKKPLYSKLALVFKPWPKSSSQATPLRIRPPPQMNKAVEPCCAHTTLHQTVSFRECTLECAKATIEEMPTQTFVISAPISCYAEQVKQVSHNPSISSTTHIPPLVGTCFPQVEIIQVPFQKAYLTMADVVNSQCCVVPSGSALAAKARQDVYVALEYPTFCQQSDSCKAREDLPFPAPPTITQDHIDELFARKVPLQQNEKNRSSDHVSFSLSRRMLQRPQESPPRVRRSASKARKDSSSSEEAFTGKIDRSSPRSPPRHNRKLASPKRQGQRSPAHRRTPSTSPRLHRKQKLNPSHYLYKKGSPHNNAASTDLRKIQRSSSCRSPAKQVSLHHLSVMASNILQQTQRPSTGRPRQATPYCSLTDLSSPAAEALSQQETHRRTTTVRRSSSSGSEVSCSRNLSKYDRISTMSSNNRRKRRKGEPQFGTNFAAILRMGLPPSPKITAESNKQEPSTPLTKVKVAVRVKSSGDPSNSYITVDQQRGQLMIRDVSGDSNIAPSCRRQAASIPKFFAFDNVFHADAQQVDICEQTVWDIVQSVIQGSDGCVISFGQSRTGKSGTLIGNDSSCSDFGVMPSAISWLYQLIENQKLKTGARFSVRVSALEIRGKEEQLTDLLASVAVGQDGAATEKLCLNENPIYGAQLENLNELRAPTAEKAGFYLDAALAAKQEIAAESEYKSSHFLLTLDIYQHHVEKPSPGGALVAGGRSRLHLIDIGQCAKSSSSTGTALTLAALGSTITALLNGQRHFPQKGSKLATLLKESIGNAGCRTCIIVHVTMQPSQHSDTLQILQLAARIHRMKVRRKTKFSSNSSDESGSTDSRLRRRGIRMGTSASYSDPDVSSSEQSVDTVIYVGNRGAPAVMSDRDFTDTESTSRSPLRMTTMSPGRVLAHHKPRVAIQEETTADNVAGSLTDQSHRVHDQQFSSPYKHAGAIKKRLSDDETSSEGRRRNLPRTNVRAWPRVNHHEVTVDNSGEQWVDGPAPPVPRDQWHIPGTSQTQTATNSTQYYQNQSPTPYYQQLHSQAVPPPWTQPGSYTLQPNPPSEQPNQWTERQVKKETAGAIVYPESHKQELWVDGPTAFTKNLKGLTERLQNESLNGTDNKRRQHRPHHHSHDKSERVKHHRCKTTRESPRPIKKCYECGCDFKCNKDGEKQKLPHSSDNKDGGGPLIHVKPFVKDWVIKHSAERTPVHDMTSENTPTQSEEPSELKEVTVTTTTNRTFLERLDAYTEGEVACDNTSDIVSSAHTDSVVGDSCAENASRESLVDLELNRQDDLHLTINLDGTELEDLTVPDTTNCSGPLPLHTDYRRDSDDILDDSVSHVTSDDRVGYESKDGGSSIDESGFADDILVDVCDAACQTDFTDVESQSTDILSVEKATPTEVTMVEVVQHEDTETRDSYLSSTLDSNLLRKPDGASDPNLNKDPTAKQKLVQMDLLNLDYSKPSASSTLPKNTKIPFKGQRIPPPTPVRTVSKQRTHSDSDSTAKPVIIQPYLSTKEALEESKEPAKHNNIQQNSPTKLPKTADMPSKLKKPAKNDDTSPTKSTPSKKSKLYKLPSLLPSKNKDSSKATKDSKASKDSKQNKSPQHKPTTHGNAETPKKEKKSLLQSLRSPYKSSKNRSAAATEKSAKLAADIQPTCCQSLPPPSSPQIRSNYDYKCSPYRKYVLPRSTLIHSDNTSDASDRHKCSTSSGYESMVPNSVEDIPSVTHGSEVKDSMEIKQYNEEDMERQQKRRIDDQQLSAKFNRRKRIDDLIYQQTTLKTEMVEAKSTLMVPGSSWSFDSTFAQINKCLENLHVAAQRCDRDDKDYLEALEQETKTLKKRVDACRSRIMVVTSLQ